MERNVLVARESAQRVGTNDKLAMFKRCDMRVSARELAAAFAHVLVRSYPGSEGIVADVVAGVHAATAVSFCEGSDDCPARYFTGERGEGGVSEYARRIIDTHSSLFSSVGADYDALAWEVARVAWGEALRDGALYNMAPVARDDALMSDRDCPANPDVLRPQARWWANGDHPDDMCHAITMPCTSVGSRTFLSEGRAVRRFRDPGVSGQRRCGGCGAPMHLHGFIDRGSEGVTICPGDTVGSDADGPILIRRCVTTARPTA